MATRTGLSMTLFVAGLMTVATIVLGRAAKLPETTADMTPWNHWRLPAIVEDEAATLEQGPVLVSVLYRVRAEHAREFLDAMRRVGRIRRRDGASRWAVFRDLEHADAYLETFLVTSWAEHVRQHDRFTRGDAAAEAAIRDLVQEEPVIRHLIRMATN
jgi:hypothetical protein